MSLDQRKSSAVSRQGRSEVLYERRLGTSELLPAGLGRATRSSQPGFARKGVLPRLGTDRVHRAASARRVRQPSRATPASCCRGGRHRYVAHTSSDSRAKRSRRSPSRSPIGSCQRPAGQEHPWSQDRRLGRDPALRARGATARSGARWRHRNRSAGCGI